jgi:hypothetical protein
MAFFLGQAQRGKVMPFRAGTVNEKRPTGRKTAYKETIVAILQIVAVNPQVRSKGFRAQFADNPHLEDPRVRFAEEMFVLYEQELGEEGDVTGFLDCFELWRKANSPSRSVASGRAAGLADHRSAGAGASRAGKETRRAGMMLP